MLEVADKSKAALLQFLGAVAPYCSEYFDQPSLTSAFLSRMAALLGDHSDGQLSSSRPPATLSVAGKRLLVRTHGLFFPRML